MSCDRRINGYTVKDTVRPLQETICTHDLTGHLLLEAASDQRSSPLKVVCTR